MPFCPVCEAFYPAATGVVKHSCKAWTTSTVCWVMVLQCDGTKLKNAPQEQLGLLADALEALAQSVNGEAHEVGLLVAPEFFFWNPKGYPKGTYLAHEKRELFAALKILSARYPHIILAPGTLPMIVPTKIPDLDEHFKHLRSVPIMPDETLPDGVRREYLNEEWAGQRERLLGTKQHFLYFNTIGIFYAGAQIIEYVKRIPFVDDSDFEAHWFIGNPDTSKDVVPMVTGVTQQGPLASPLNVAKVKHLRLGVEICAEHQYGTLHASGSLPCDIHVLVANSMEEEFPAQFHTAVGRAGLFVHSDAKLDQCSVGIVDKEAAEHRKLPELSKTAMVATSPSKLLLFRCPLTTPIRLGA
jgi:predicted amidohydrolase